MARGGLMALINPLIATAFYPYKAAPTSTGRLLSSPMTKAKTKKKGKKGGIVGWVTNSLYSHMHSNRPLAALARHPFGAHSLPR